MFGPMYASAFICRPLLLFAAFAFWASASFTWSLPQVFIVLGVAVVILLASLKFGNPVYTNASALVHYLKSLLKRGIIVALQVVKRRLSGPSHRRRRRYYIRGKNGKMSRIAEKGKKRRLPRLVEVYVNTSAGIGKCRNLLRNVAFDSDSSLARIDCCATACITNDIRDIDITSARWVKLQVKTVEGTSIIRALKGNLRWKIHDDDGRAHVVEVRESYFIANASTKLLSPQHWAQVAEGDNVRCLVDKFGIKLFWGNGYSKTCDFDKESENVGSLRVGIGYESSGKHFDKLSHRDLEITTMPFLTVPTSECIAAGGMTSLHNERVLNGICNKVDSKAGQGAMGKAPAASPDIAEKEKKKTDSVMLQEVVASRITSSSEQSKETLFAAV